MNKKDTSNTNLNNDKNIIKHSGGLYHNVKMSVKSANILVIVTSLALLFTIIFLISNA